MTEDEIKVIARLCPEQLIELGVISLNYHHWCRVSYKPTGRLCIRVKGHDGPHFTMRGLKLKPGSYQNELMVACPLHRPVIWWE